MKIIIRQLGVCDYEPIWKAMRDFTEQRNQQSNDEIWLLEHPPLFTQGLAGKSEHLLNPGSIPVLQTERGGQVTYHGPGQLICYVLIDLKRHSLGIKTLVSLLEQSIIDLLAKYQISGQRRTKAPGVYVNNAKVAALGLRVRKGCTFHGLAINIEMDLEPFSRINPCGYAGLEVTQISDLVTEDLVEINRDKMAKELAILLCTHLNYNQQDILWKTSLVSK